MEEEKKLEEAGTKMFSFRLELETINELQRIAEETDSSQAEIIKMCIRLSKADVQKRLQKIQIMKGFESAIIKEE